MTVIYSPMPVELMFPSQIPTNRHYIQKEGRLMEVELLDFNQAKIVRIISTDPRDYLDDKYQPGNFL